ncbi:MAG: hypothetical protein Q8P45_02010 [Candidatus Harrisonbacteria bacterium]|nr:hypothetical protein [Candidatus Harrisonbacteria bacterium]
MDENTQNDQGTDQAAPEEQAAPVAPAEGGDMPAPAAPADDMGAAPAAPAEGGEENTGM